MPADLSSALDVRSVTVVSGVLGLVMSAVTFFMWRSFPASIRGLREWAWAPLVGFVSALLFSGRGVLPDLVSVVGANMLLFVASPQVHWTPAAVLGAGAILGGLAGAWALRRVNERLLRAAIVVLGLALTAGLFLRPI